MRGFLASRGAFSWRQLATMSFNTSKVGDPPFVPRFGPGDVPAVCVIPVGPAPPGPLMNARSGAEILALQTA